MIAVGWADNIMVGHYSTAALASASLVNNVFNVAIFACIGFTYGITPLVGALYAQKRQWDIGSTIHNALIINLVFSLFVMLVMGILYLNLEHLGQPEELMPIVKPYYLIYLAGLPAVTLFGVFAQWSYGITRTKPPMWIILGCNALNVVANYALIFGHWGFPEMGLTGAGWATFMARWLSLIVIAAMFLQREEFAEARHGLKEARLSRATGRKVWATSWPVMAQMVCESGSFTICAVMVGWLGAIELASFQIMIMLGTLGFCVYYSMATAVAVLVSNAKGLDDRHAMRRIAFSGYHIILALALIASLIFAFLGHPIVHFFTEDALVIACTLTLIFPLIFYQLADATQITFANALRGTSRVKPMMWIALMSYIVVGLPVTYLFGFTFGWGIVGIIFSISVPLIMAATLFLYYFLNTTSLEHSSTRAFVQSSIRDSK